MFCIILLIDNFVLRVFPLLKFYVHVFFFKNLLLKTVYCQEHPSGQTEQEHFPLVLIFLLQQKLKDLIFPSFLKSLQAFNLFLQMFKELCRVTLGKDISCLTFRAVTTTSSHWGKYAVVCYVSFFYERILFCRNG